MKSAEIRSTGDSHAKSPPDADSKSQPEETGQTLGQVLAEGKQQAYAAPAGSKPEGAGPSSITSEVDESISPTCYNNIEYIYPSQSEGQGRKLSDNNKSDLQELRRILKEFADRIGPRAVYQAALELKPATPEPTPLSPAPSDAALDEFHTHAETVTAKGWVRTSALPPEVADARRKAGAERQRTHVDNLSPEIAAARRAHRTQLQKKRRANRRALVDPK